MASIEKLIQDIEDHVVPRLRLDIGEARLYYHLLRHSRLTDKHEAVVSVAQLCNAMNCSKNAVKPRLRTLEEKRVIEITNTGWAGTTVKVFLPQEIPGAMPEHADEEYHRHRVAGLLQGCPLSPSDLRARGGTLLLLPTRPV